MNRVAYFRCLDGAMSSLKRNGSVDGMPDEDAKKFRDEGLQSPDELRSSDSVEGVIVETQSELPETSNLSYEHWQRLMSCTADRLRYLYEHGDFADCSVTVGCSENQKTYRLHKTFLCMTSSKLKSIVSETTGSHLSLPDITPKVFDVVHAYIYLDSTTLISDVTACEVYKTAFNYEIPHLLTETRKYLLVNLSPENFWNVLELGVESHDVDIQTECCKYISKYPSIWQQDKLSSVNKNVLALILDLEPVDVAELDVLKAVDRWAIHWCGKREIPVTLQSKREVLGPEIISKIRFLALPPKDFVAFCCDSGCTQNSFLTTEEMFAILANLNLFGSVQLPDGLSQKKIPRGFQKFRVNRRNAFKFCVTPGNSHEKAYALSCPTQSSPVGSKHFLLNIKADKNVVFHGIQVPALWYPPFGMKISEYDETYTIVVTDCQNNILSRIVDSFKVSYASFVDIFLSENVFFKANEEYRVSVVTSQNTYYLSKKFLSQEQEQGVTFTFYDSVSCSPPQKYPQSFTPQTCLNNNVHNDFGFVLQVIVSLS